MKVVVLAGQTLADIALQVYGSVEGVFVLAQENGLEVTDTLLPGQELEYQPENVLNKGVTQYYATERIYPATSFDRNISEGVFDETFDLTFN